MGAFVGRGRELGELGDEAARARRGESRVVLIEGDAGIGKSSLLSHFASSLTHTGVLRASGDEAEVLLAYGVVSQLAASAKLTGKRLSKLLDRDLDDTIDPLAVGAELLGLLGQTRGDQSLVLAVVDDLDWADSPSGRALLFALRRLRADPALVVLSARAGELSRLGEAWQRFLSGDYRARRLRVGGLGTADLAALSEVLGAGLLSLRAAERLMAFTGGNPLLCRALLEEFGADYWDRVSGHVRVPRALAEVLLLPMGRLTPEARALIVAAAVLGTQCSLPAAAALADLDNVFPALDEAAGAGILIEYPERLGPRIGFTHALVHQAVYEDLSPGRRRQLHQRAANLVDRHLALEHRVAASVAADDRLAGELEEAANQARKVGRMAQAAAWFTRAAGVSSEIEDADRRLLEALDLLVTFGQVAEAQAVATRVASSPSSARRSMILGALELLAGRTSAAEVLLAEAWQAHDPVSEPSVGVGAAVHMVPLCLNGGRVAEAVRWGERAARPGVPSVLSHHALGVEALALSFDGRGRAGLSRLAFLPSAPSEVAREDTDVLVMRGMAKSLVEDMPEAIADLSAAAARLRSGVPMRYASQCLSVLADTEYRLGSWDDAVVHGELAVSLAHDADRFWDFGFVHGFAALVPSARGDWEVAATHVRLAMESARGYGAPEAIATAATAEECLAMAQGDLERVVAAAETVRATGQSDVLGRPGHFDWRTLEIEALIGLGRFDHAHTALAELERVLTPGGPISALLATARLRGALAIATGQRESAAEAFAVAWQTAQGLRMPLALALLEMADSRQLRATGQPERAVARLRSARRRCLDLAARPYLEICDRELARMAASAPQGELPALLGLTPSELAVARLVAAGRSNRQVAEDLYVSVKTVEFHLGHVFLKLGIGSRKQLLSELQAPSSSGQNQGRT